MEPLESAINEHRNRNHFPRWEKKRGEKKRKEKKRKRRGKGRDNLERGILIKIHGYQPRVAEQKTKEPRKNIEKIPRMTNETAPSSLVPFNPPSFCRSSRVLFIHVTVHEDRRIPEYTFSLRLGSWKVYEKGRLAWVGVGRERGKEGTTRMRGVISRDNEAFRCPTPFGPASKRKIN